MITNENYLCTLIGSMIVSYKLGKLNDLDLYNSIIRLITTTEGTEKKKLERIVKWLSKYDSLEELESAMKDKGKVREELGEDYMEWIMIMASVTSTGVNVKK